MAQGGVTDSSGTSGGAMPKGGHGTVQNGGKVGGSKAGRSSASILDAERAGIVAQAQRAKAIATRQISAQKARAAQAARRRV